MAECYRLPGWLLIGLSMLIALCVVFQALAVTYSFRRLCGGWVRWAENLLEIGVLLHLFLCAGLIAQVQYNTLRGFLLPGGYEVLRQGVFLFVAVLSIFAAIGLEMMWPLVTGVAAAVLLPSAERLPGAACSFLFVGSILFYLLRSAHICLLRRREMRTKISANSVKEAIDKLHTGLLFCHSDGEPLLCNRQMEKLLQCCTGAYIQNGEAFFRLLQDGTLRPDCRREEMGGHPAVRLPDHTIWIFRHHEFDINHRRCILLSATDMTDQWTADQSLYEQNRELERRGNELRQTIDNL